MSDFLKSSDPMELWLTTLKNYVNEELEKVCENLKTEVPARLLESISYSLLAPGKRIRPILAYFSAASVQGGNLALETLRKVTPAALAVEMIHAYSLIHDDLPAMDDDDYRRGRLTNHKKFDEATAILAGDALQPLAMDLLATEIGNETPEIAVQAVQILSRGAGALGMVGGQMDDIYFSPDACRPILPMTLLGCFPTLSGEFCQKELEKFGNSSRLTELRALESMQDRKTGALITSAVMLGGLIAGASEEQLFRLGLYGQYLGLMFQITDDLLDATSTAEVMGKKVGKDTDKGKTTWVNHLGIEDSRQYVERLATLAEEEIGQDAFQDATPLISLLKYVAQRNH
ncbi:MAG: polyprenyl synthetase family protein [Planctomycetia bacterium]|nr:polyprenyl synthetase family protein [Planctomycetia bacterium]